MTDYVAQFHACRCRAVRSALHRLSQDVNVSLDERDRARALGALNYVLNDGSGWPEAWHLIDQLAPRMEQAGYREGWKEYLERGIRLSQIQSDEQAEAELLIHMGYLNLQLAQYALADQYFERSLVLFESGKDFSGKGRALNHLAMIALRQNKYRKARKFAQDALYCLPEGDTDRANSFYVLGTTAYESGDAEEAIQLLERSLDIRRVSGDRRKIAWGLLNLGPALRLTGRKAEAQECYENAIQILAEIVDPINYARALNNLGIVHSDLGYSCRSIKLYEEAVQVFRELNELQSLARTYLNMGIDLRKLSRFIDSEEFLLKSIQIRSSLQLESLVCNSMYELWITYMAIGNEPKSDSMLLDLTSRLDKMRQPDETAMFADGLLKKIQRKQRDLLT